MTRAVRTALIAWAAITLLVAASLLWIYARLGTSGFGIYIQQPPLINLPVTLASVALGWLSAGALLLIILTGRICRSNILSIGGFFLVSWVYLNILSERFRYGDYTYYFDAAVKLYNHQPLPGSYFYLPLWATIIQYLAPLGENAFFLILWLLNFLSLLVFYILLHRILRRYGFSPQLAAPVTILFVLANAPLLRTLVYVQINLHVLNLILLSLLLYPRRVFLSALCLAIAVHLKTAPAVLVLAFLLEKDWRWLGWFVLSMIGIGGLTVATNGFAPFLDSLRNVQDLALSGNTIFHDTSFDSFLRFAGPIFHLSPRWIQALIYTAKALLAAATIAVMIRCVRTRAFYENDQRGRSMLNAVPPLFILMTLASPIVWEHHGIFLTLSFLLLLKRLEQPSDWLWFGFAYLLEFLLPTFDFFPWSFGRLLAPLIILALMWKTAAYGPSPYFGKIDNWLKETLA
jgi:hypothetical protein